MYTLKTHQFDFFKKLVLKNANLSTKDFDGQHLLSVLFHDEELIKNEVEFLKYYNVILENESTRSRQELIENQWKVGLSNKV